MRITIMHYAITFVLLTGLTTSVIAMAQPKPASSANIPNATTQIAESPDETAFKQMLVKNSPWKVEWESETTGNTGTHQITFAPGQDAATLSGRFLGSSRNSPGPLSDIVLKKNCVSLTLSTGSRYDYCLAGDRTLKGPYEGETGSGYSFSGKAVAKPAAQ